MAQQVVSGADMQRMLHEKWNPLIRANIQRSAPEAQMIKWETVKPEGKHWEETQQIGGNFYMRAMPERGYLPGKDPAATAQDAIPDITTAQAKYKVSELSMLTDFTGLMRAITTTSSSGFVNLAKKRIKDVTENIKFMMCTRIAGSKTGVVAKIKSVNTSTGVVTLYNQNNDGPEGGNRFLKVGQCYDAVVNTGRVAILRQEAGDRGRRATAVSRNNVPTTSDPTVTFYNLTDCTWTTDDYLVMYNTRTPAAITDADGWQDSLYNPWGIQDVADDGTMCPYIGGVTRVSGDTFSAIVHDSGTQAPAVLDDFNSLVEDVQTETSGTLDWWYAHPSQQRFLMNSVMAQVYPGVTGNAGYPRGGRAQESLVRHNDPGAKVMKLGYGGVAITTIGENGVMNIRSSRLAPMHEIIGFPDETMKMLNLAEPGFARGDGLTVRKDNDRNVYTAAWEWFTGGVVSEAHWNIGVMRSKKGSPRESP